MAEVLAEDLGLHGGGVMHDDAAGVPLDEMVVGRVGQHAGEMEEELGDGTAGGRLRLELLQGGGRGRGGIKGCATHGWQG